MPYNLSMQDLRSYEAVGYRPLSTEPDPISCLTTQPLVRFVVSPDSSLEPNDIAKKVTVFFGHSNVCVYIPGTAFDKNGVRHGRGGGWYDRFLSAVPSEWIRIGFCYENQFSSAPLKQEPWDELVDWICIKKVDRTEYYQTNARFKS